MRLIDADAFDKCLEQAETEATRNRKYVFSSAINTIRGNLTNFPTIASQWIPCSERLPEVGQSVLISIGKGMTVAEGCLRDDGDWCQFRWETIWSAYYVDAWMPLPEPYEKRE